MNRTSMYIPTLDIDVVITFLNDPMKFKIEYDNAKMKYTEDRIRVEVKKVIIGLMKEINKELDTIKK